MARQLPDVTCVCITTRDYGESISAIHKTLEKITPAKTMFFTDIDIKVPGAEVIQVEIKSWKEYNHWIMRQLYKYIETSHVLLIQQDGYVLDETVWSDTFLNYDYIGARWFYTDGRNVGNGGFSLRSKRLMTITALDPAIEITCPEDEVICRLYRTYLEQKCDIKFASEDVADKFSFELNPPLAPTFGFHQYHHQPYKPHICLKRHGAAGDIIMMEPVLEYYHNKGYKVFLDTDKKFHNYYNNHYFPVHWIGNHNPKIKFDRVINLDMSYEISPKQPVLQSYFNICGITDGVIRNSKLNFKVNSANKLFNKLVVLHIDETDMPHRNVHGINWKEVVRWIKEQGYEVMQIGKRSKIKAATHFNCATEAMMMLLIGSADLFIGLDSGPGQVAVALGIPSVLFFGSVNPNYRYNDFSKIKVIQNECEFAGCYHEAVGSVIGQDCRINKKQPPCITHDCDDVISEIMEFMNSGFVNYPPIGDWKKVKQSNENNKPSYESLKRFLGFGPGLWGYDGYRGMYIHSLHNQAQVSEEVIKKRTDVFKIIEQ